MSVNLLVFFHTINNNGESLKLFPRTIAPYVHSLYLLDAIFRIKFDCEFIGTFEINVSGFIFHSYDSLGDYVSEH